MKLEFIPDPCFVGCEERGSAVMVKDMRPGERAFMRNGGVLTVVRRDATGQFVVAVVESTGVQIKIYEESFVVPEKHWPA